MKRWTAFAPAAFAALLVTSELKLNLALAGAGPDLLIIVVVVFAGVSTPRAACGMGFAAGLFRDLLLTTPLGLGAFAYGLVAYGVAIVGATRGVWAFIGLVSGATFLSQTLHGITVAILGEGVDSGTFMRVVVVTTVYNAILAPLLMPLLRWLLATEPATAGVAE